MYGHGASGRRQTLGLVPFHEPARGKAARGAIDVTATKS